jgi:hypothetical protein
MEEPRRLAIGYGNGLACSLVAVVRNHLDSMPGPERDRPGWDRVRLRLPDGSEVLTDLWSRGGQDVAKAPREIVVYDEGDLICWRPVAEARAEASAPANDVRPLRLAS